MPFLDVGSLAGGPAFEFDIVEDALRLDDGSVVVADFGSRQIRRFGPDGALRWFAGREGDGPGEVNRSRTITRSRGDSLLVFVGGIGRGTGLCAGGERGRGFRVETTGRSDRVYPLNDSTLVAVFLALDALERGEGLVRMPEPLARIRPDGTLIDTIAVVPGGESFLVPEAEVRPLFGRRGSQIAVANGSVYIGTADLLGYGIHAEDGTPIRLVRAPTFDLTLSGEQIEAERATLLTDRSPPWFRAAVATLPTPSTRPAYSQLLVDPEGAVWLAPYRGRSERGVPMPWQVFSAEGEWLGAVMFPERMRVREIGLDYVLGVRLDEDDIEHIQLLPLRRD
jgi:hypothetical protein